MGKVITKKKKETKQFLSNISKLADMTYAKIVAQ